MYAAHRDWAQRHAEPLTRLAPPHVNERSPDRRLRVGYVSPDFREHPDPRFFGPLLRHHDRAEVEVYCYADVPRPDGVTARLRQSAVRDPADRWRDVSCWSDEQLASAIRRDRVDILVDLAGHTGNRRLGVFARKPAPVQVAYVGYPDTTGMSAMDYRLTDSLHDPPGEADALHTEKLVRLDPCCWCYNPGLGCAVPEVGELPVLSRGHVTFGAFNRLIKVTPRMAKLWAAVLEAVPGSRLAMLGGPGEDAQSAAEGTGPSGPGPEAGCTAPANIARGVPQLA